MNSVLSAAQVSLIHASGLLNHSVSKHLMHPRRHFLTLPLSATGFPLPLGSGLHLSRAGSSSAPGRIEFVILRTGRSPPAALHHASLRRSSSWLQAGERLPGEDFHLSERARFQARVRRGCASPLAIYWGLGCAPGPAFGPYILGAEPEPGAQPHLDSGVERRGRASPHIRRRSRSW